jgi:hypothetical protein
MLGLIAGFYPASSYAQRGPGVAVNAPAEIPQATKPADARPTLVARIEGVLSTKNAKAGDHLTAKTLKSWKLADGTDIPKGSKLVADVTFAQSKAAGNGNSLLAFRFDKAEVKGGGTVPIHGLVVAIGPDLGPKESIGANSVMGRGGVGSTAGLDPSIGVGKPPGARDEFDIPLGSTLPEVKVGRPLNADWTTALRGTKEDIWLDSDVLIKVDFK